jgi:hypothetical protein
MNRQQGADFQFNPASEESPIMKGSRKKPASLFAPGLRMRMNVVPIFLNIFIPWGIFVYCYGLTSSYIMYMSPVLAWMGVLVVAVLWLASVYSAYYARRYNPDPTWFTVTSLLVLIMAIWGVIGGLGNFANFESPYYNIQDMRTATGIDPSLISSEDVMDAGIIHFTPGTQLADQKTWHFHLESTYCVAPIISNTSIVPLRQTYDFWAVGKDCCSLQASDFRCGSWASIQAHKGLRTLNVDDLTYYHLAVQQAEALYGIMAPHPIFFDWSVDPVAETNSWHQQSFKNYAVMAFTAFVTCAFIVTMATCSFAWLGRSNSAAATEFYNDADWKDGSYNQEAKDFSTKMYTA